MGRSRFFFLWKAYQKKKIIKFICIFSLFILHVYVYTVCMCRCMYTCVYTYANMWMHGRAVHVHVCVRMTGWHRSFFPVTICFSYWGGRSPSQKLDFIIPARETVCLGIPYCRLQSASAGVLGKLPFQLGFVLEVWLPDLMFCGKCFIYPAPQPPSPISQSSWLKFNEWHLFSECLLEICSPVMSWDDFLHVNETLPAIYLHLFSAQQTRPHVAS